MQRRCRGVHNRSHGYHNHSPSLFKGCSHVATKNTRLTWSERCIVVHRNMNTASKSTCKIFVFGGTNAMKNSLNVEECYVVHDIYVYRVSKTFIIFLITRGVHIGPIGDISLNVDGGTSAFSTQILLPPQTKNINPSTTLPTTMLATPPTPTPRVFSLPCSLRPHWHLLSIKQRQPVLFLRSTPSAKGNCLWHRTD